MGSSRTAPAPKAAALRKMAPRFSWSFTPSTTITTAKRSCASRSAGDRPGSRPGQAEQAAVHVVPRCRRHYLLVGHVHGQTRLAEPSPRAPRGGGQDKERTQRVRGGEHRLESEHAFDDENAPG